MSLVEITANQLEFSEEQAFADKAEEFAGLVDAREFHKARVYFKELAPEEQKYITKNSDYNLRLKVLRCSSL